jgi:hypothetical protein
MPLPYPYDIICFLFGAIGLFFYLMYLRHNYLRREAIRKENASPEIPPPIMEFLATGLDINLVSLIISGEEPFKLIGVIVHKINDGRYLITITGELKDE